MSERSLERIGFAEKLYPVRCAHCGVEFEGRWGQYKHVKYGNTKTYCSRLCKLAALPKPPIRGNKRPVFIGTCEKCGKTFESKTNKFFCGLACYVRSDRHKAHLRKNAPVAAQKSAHICKQRGREIRYCIFCKSSFETIKSSPKKYCMRLCMRKWMADRFDRWIASPQSIALPQNYDEFLSSQTLPCLIDGCNWVGSHLSLHVNQAHGVPAREFKRAARFNLGSGIISAQLQQTLSRRQKAGVAIAQFEHAVIGANYDGYISLEGIEHAAKARAITLLTGYRPWRVCAGCSVTFEQSTPYGRTKYCSIACRRKNSKHHYTTDENEILDR